MHSTIVLKNYIISLAGEDFLCARTIRICNIGRVQVRPRKSNDGKFSYRNMITLKIIFEVRIIRWQMRYHGLTQLSWK